MLCNMSSYELSATIISVLALIATIFFGWTVWKLSKESNKINKEANKIALQDLQLKKQNEKTILDDATKNIPAFFAKTNPDAINKNMAQVNKKIIKRKKKK